MVGDCRRVCVLPQKLRKIWVTSWWRDSVFILSNFPHSNGKDIGESRNTLSGQ